MKQGCKRGFTGILMLCMVMAFLPLTWTEDAAFAATSTGKSTSVHLNKTNTTVLQGKTRKLKVKGLQKDRKTGKKLKVKWKSSNSRIASVNKKGLVKAKRGGKAVITATIKYSKKKKTRLTCTVNVLRTTSRNAAQVWKYVKAHGKYEDENEDGFTYTVGTNPSLIVDSALGMSFLEFYYGSRKKTYPDYDTVYMDSQLMNNQFNNYVYVELELGSRPRDVYTLCGRIYGNYDGGSKGIVFTSVKDRYWREYTGFTGQQLQTYKAEAVKSVSHAFHQFNSLTKAKTGYTMKQIGFTKWK